MRKYFADIDFNGFWNNHQYYLENYVEKPLTDEMVALTETELGYKLPDSYIEFLKIQNGGRTI